MLPHRLGGFDHFGKIESGRGIKMHTTRPGTSGAWGAQSTDASSRATIAATAASPRRDPICS